MCDICDRGEGNTIGREYPGDDTSSVGVCVQLSTGGVDIQLLLPSAYEVNFGCVCMCVHVSGVGVCAKENIINRNPKD